MLPDHDSTEEVDPRLVATLLDSDNPPLLIDCREQDEYDFCKIVGAHLIPLSRFTEFIALIDIPDTGAIVYCHHGMRSLHATQFLRQKGAKNVFSMAGGIDRWSTEIDSEVPRY